MRVKQIALWVAIGTASMLVYDLIKTKVLLDGCDCKK